MLDSLLDRFQPTKKRPAPAMDTADDRRVVAARGAAAAIDLVIYYFLLEAPVLWAAGRLSPGSLDPYGGVVVASFLFLVPLYITYSFGFEWRYGRTPGKVNRGLVVVMADGSDCTGRASAVRNMLRYVDLLGIPPVVIGLVVALVNDGRRVGDVAADTRVVRTRVEGPQGQPATSDLETDAAARRD